MWTSPSITCSDASKPVVTSPWKSFIGMSQSMKELLAMASCNQFYLNLYLNNMNVYTCIYTLYRYMRMLSFWSWWLVPSPYQQHCGRLYRHHHYHHYHHQYHHHHYPRLAFRHDNRVLFLNDILFVSSKKKYTSIVMIGFISSYSILTLLAALCACACVSAKTAPMIWPQCVTWGNTIRFGTVMIWCCLDMETFFRINGPLWLEYTTDCWIPLT